MFGWKPKEVRVPAKQTHASRKLPLIYGGYGKIAEGTAKLPGEHGKIAGRAWQNCAYIRDVFYGGFIELGVNIILIIIKFTEKHNES